MQSGGTAQTHVHEPHTYPYTRVLINCQSVQSEEDGVSESVPPGKINNHALFKQYRDLRPGLEEGHDFVAVSEKSWNQLNSWCHFSRRLQSHPSCVCPLAGLRVLHGRCLEPLPLEVNAQLQAMTHRSLSSMTHSTPISQEGA